MTPVQDRTELWTTVQRCLHRRCPNCGQSKLFASYLKQVERCGSCGERFGHIRADDGPPWLTILLVGHLALPVIFAVESHAVWPSWAAMVMWPSLIGALSLLVLPYAKALFIGVIWAKRAPGSEE